MDTNALENSSVILSRFEENEYPAKLENVSIRDDCVMQKRVRNGVGGRSAGSTQIDPSFARYERFATSA